MMTIMWPNNDPRFLLQQELLRKQQRQGSQVPPAAPAAASGSMFASNQPPAAPETEPVAATLPTGAASAPHHLELERALLLQALQHNADASASWDLLRLQQLQEQEARRRQLQMLHLQSLGALRAPPQAAMNANLDDYLKLQGSIMAQPPGGLFPQVPAASTALAAYPNAHQSHFAATTATAAPLVVPGTAASLSRKSAHEVADRASSTESVSRASSSSLRVGPQREKRKAAHPKKKNIKWFSMLDELKKYKEENGNCIVPRGYPPNPKLASWVAEQRKQYRLFRDGKQSSITQERIDLLEELDFAWNAQEDAWKRHFEDLKKFRAETGHCHVPLKHPKYPKLGLWVKEARRHHTLLKQGKQSHMTAERVEKLNSIGFCWDTHEATWLDRLSELKVFKEENGHCIVPTNYATNPRLGTWVHHQRRQYKKFNDGRPCHITHDRIQALNELGFVWNLRQGSGDSAASSSDDEATESEDEVEEEMDGELPRKRRRFKSG